MSPEEKRAKQLEYKRNWARRAYQSNPEKYRTRSREQYEKTRNDPQKLERYRDKSKQWVREWRARNPEKRAAQNRRSHNKTRYKITLAEREALLAAQGGVCAVCSGNDWGRRGDNLDHCHATDRVRGILCQKCNTTLGRLDDNAEGVRKWCARFLAYLAAAGDT